MYLINASTLKLERFDDHAHLPAYAILSHTWGTAEVTFEQAHELPDVPPIKTRHSPYKNGPGHRKIRMTCTQALIDGLEYAWVDTCCIDKRSSAELSEAINSMWSWYENATVCYAYLEDVGPTDAAECDQIDQYGISKDLWNGGLVSVDVLELAEARWFTRGWTLQELLAPQKIIFYGKEWTYLGTKYSLKSDLARITRIDEAALHRSNLKNFGVARRMSWAAHRVTTRVEDMAYSLLGLFDVNMPLLYGEGHKAFERLQEAIMKDSNDQSLLAWAPTYKAPKINRMAPAQWRSVFASHPNEFASSSISRFPFPSGESFNLTNKGMRMVIPLVPFRHQHRALNWESTFTFLYNPVLHKERPLFTVILDCTFAQGDFQHHRVGIVCQRVVGTEDQLVRHNSAGLMPIDHKVLELALRMEVFLPKKIPPAKFSIARPLAPGSNIDVMDLKSRLRRLGPGYSKEAAQDVIPDALRVRKQSRKASFPTEEDSAGKAATMRS